MSESLRGGSHATPAKGGPFLADSVPDPVEEVEQVGVDDEEERAVSSGEEVVEEVAEVEEETVEVTVEDELFDLTNAVLRDIADELSISGSSGMNKAELVAAIVEARAAVDEAAA